MANEFIARNGIIALNSSTVTGSLTITNGITGSLSGTSSWALNFITSSITSASYATNATYVETASSADSFNVRTSLTASNILVNNTITAQTLVVQTITSSIEYSSGSNIFGSLTSNVQAMTGSLRVTGSGNHYILGGKVGIGTTSPTYSLDVTNTVKVGGGGWISNVFGNSVNWYTQRNLGSTSDYQQHVILLCPIYDTTLLEYNTVMGTVYASRGGSSLGDIISDTYEVSVATARTFTNANLQSINGIGKLYTCTYLGIKYIALMPQYRQSAAYYNFSGFAGNTTGSLLTLISYYNTNTSTVLNAEVSSSLAVYSSNVKSNFDSTVYVSSSVSIGVDTPTSKLHVYSSTGGVFEVDGVNNNTIMYITSSGNVGINTLTPTSKLHVSSSTGGVFEVDGVNNNTIMYITSSGNVGINTLTPTNNLQVSGSSNVVNFRGSGSTTTSSIFTVDGAAGRLFSVNDSLSGSLFSVNTIAGLPVIEAFSNNTVRIGQYGQKALFVSQSSVGIGIETPIFKLDVSGSGRFTGSLNIPRLVGITPAPTIVSGSGAGTNATVSSVGTDLAGSLRIKTGTGPTALAQIGTVTFSATYTTAPYVVFSPANTSSAALSSSFGIYVTSSTTGFTAFSNISALPATTQYTWSYHVIQ